MFYVKEFENVFRIEQISISFFWKKFEWEEVVKSVCVMIELFFGSIFGKNFFEYKVVIVIEFELFFEVIEVVQIEEIFSIFQWN